MVTPQKRTAITRRRKKSDSSSSEESEALDYTISPQTQFFQNRISTPYPSEMLTRQIGKSCHNNRQTIFVTR